MAAEVDPLHKWHILFFTLMNADDLFKVAPDLAKGATALAAAIPFTAMVKRMLGPAADELAEMWRDKVRLYRYERQLRCVEKAEKMAEAAGFTPQAVPPKILFPLLEGSSLEEDENLHDMWAALLANASSPENSERVRPGFIAALKQMSPDEAALLKWMCGQKGNIGYRDAKRAYLEMGFAELVFEIAIDGLEAANLVHAHDYYVLSGDDPARVVYEEIDYYSGTRLGEMFIEACQPPSVKS